MILEMVADAGKVSKSCIIEGKEKDTDFDKRICERFDMFFEVEMRDKTSFAVLSRMASFLVFLNSDSKIREFSSCEWQLFDSFIISDDLHFPEG